MVGLGSDKIIGFVESFVTMHYPSANELGQPVEPTRVALKSKMGSHPFTKAIAAACMLNQFRVKGFKREKAQYQTVQIVTYIWQTIQNDARSQTLWGIPSPVFQVVREGCLPSFNQIAHMMRECNS